MCECDRSGQFLLTILSGQENLSRDVPAYRSTLSVRFCVTVCHTASDETIVKCHLTTVLFSFFTPVIYFSNRFFLSQSWVDPLGILVLI